MWQKKRLGDVATFINGYPFKPSEWKDEGLEIIRIQNLTKSSKECNYFKGEINSKYKINDGDILISWSATLGVFEWKGNDAWLNQHIFKVEFDKEPIDKKFFIFLIKHVLDDLKGQVHGATMKHITKTNFDNTLVPIPSLDQQKAIAEKLDKADALRKKDQELLKQYDDLAQAIFIDIFGDPVQNEKGWEKLSLNKFGKISTGNTPSRKEEHYYNENYIEWIKTDNILADSLIISKATEYLSLEGSKKGRIVNKGTLLVACIAGSIESIGRCSLTNRKVAFNQQINSIEPFENVNSLFLYSLIKNSSKYIQDFASNGMKRMLSKGEFEKIPFILPPISLQNQFAEKIKNIEAQKAIAKQQAEESENLFQALLQASFTFS